MSRFANSADTTKPLNAVGAAPARSTATTTYVPLRPEERAVIDAIRELPFGAVEVVVHQARIVQIVKTEKLRVESAQ
jgi:hypothetical protein